jgi:hypothetical protein
MKQMEQLDGHNFKPLEAYMFNCSTFTPDATITEAEKIFFFNLYLFYRDNHLSEFYLVHDPTTHFDDVGQRVIE